MWVCQSLGALSFALSLCLSLIFMFGSLFVVFFWGDFFSPDCYRRCSGSRALFF
jgi:hypothetical protein